MKKSKFKLRLYDIRKMNKTGNWKYVGLRYYYYDEIGNIYILSKGYYLPADILRDRKGSLLVTNYTKTYAKRVK